MAVREDGHFLYGFATEGRARHLPPAPPGGRHRRAHRAGGALRLSVATSPRPSRCRIRPAGEDSRHRQEDRRAPAPRTARQARWLPARRWPAGVTANLPATTGPTSSTPLLAPATTRREALGAVKTLPEGVGVSGRHPPGPEEAPCAMAGAGMGFASARPCGRAWCLCLLMTVPPFIGARHRCGAPRPNPRPWPPCAPAYRPGGHHGHPLARLCLTDPLLSPFSAAHRSCLPARWPSPGLAGCMPGCTWSTAGLRRRVDSA